MASYDIAKHFGALRVQTGRRRGRDPFATGFEDDSEPDSRKSRTKTKAAPVVKPTPTAPANTNSTVAKSTPVSSSAAPAASALDHLRDSDDEFLDPPTAKRNDRRPSPAPAKLAAQRVIDGAGRRGSLPGALPSYDPKKAAVLAAGALAYLDEDSSSDEEPAPRRPSRTDRRPSPAPRKSADRDKSTERSQTPRGDRLSPKEAITSPRQNSVVPKHTVASPFAGTVSIVASVSSRDHPVGVALTPGLFRLEIPARQ